MSEKEPQKRRWKAHPTGICEVEGCDRKHVSRGYCGMHLARLRRTGKVGSAIERMQAASRLAVDADPRMAQLLALIVSKIGKRWVVRSNGRSHVRLSGEKGKPVTFARPRLQALGRRGWILECTPKDWQDQKLWVVTDQGESKLKEAPSTLRSQP